MSTFPFITSTVKSSREGKTNYKDYELANGMVTGHKINGIDAITTWARRCLETQRFAYPIYSWDYGIDLDGYIGNGYTKELIDAELSRDIAEALMQHPSITAVKNFVITANDDDLHVTCTIETIFGGAEIAV